MVIGIWGIVVQMPIPFVKIGLVLIVAYLDYSIFHPKGIPKILPGLIVVDLNRPVV
jgi:hypothetical protein